MAGGTAFGAWFGQQRRQLGVSRQELAATAESSEVLVTKLESGARKPSVQTALLLAQFFGVPEDERQAFVLFARSDLPVDRLRSLKGYDPDPGSFQSEQRLVSPWRALYRQLVHLPQPSTAFIGREEALARALEILGNRRTRLLTLLGPPGIGKTRLGLRVAESAASDFPDGVYFVGLATVREAGLVLTSIARALGVQETGGRDLPATLERHLEHKRLLLLMDNFEQALSGARYVARLLRAAPGVKVVATSREALHLRGEREFQVPFLAVADADDKNDAWSAGDSNSRGPRSLSLDTVGKFEAVRLFLERARASDPRFALTPDNAADIVELCISLDRLPLAIELAAARAPLNDPSAILAVLRRHTGSAPGDMPQGGRLQLLAGGPRDLTPRQQALRGAIDWSYELLSEDEQRLFRSLSVFRGGFTALIAGDVLGNVGAVGDAKDSYVGAGIHSLAGKSLLQTEAGLHTLIDSQVPGELGSEPKFSMLETIREYAGEKLEESGEAYHLGNRHARYFMAMAEEAEPHLTGAGQQEWLDRLEYEYENIRAALWWARTVVEAADGIQQDSVAMDEDTEIGLRLAGALWRFWYVRGYISEGREQLEGMLDRLAAAEGASSPVLSSAGGADSRLTEQPAIKAKALNAAGLLAYRQGDYAAARSFQEESLAIRRELGDMKTVASTLNNLGLVAYMEQDYEASRALYEESLAIRRELGDKLGITNSLNNLGILADEQGDYTWARSLYEESLAIRRELGDKFGIAASLNNLGAVAYHHGDYLAARRLQEESLAIRRELNEKWGIAMCLLNLGQISYREADGERARQLYLEALTLFYELGDRQALAGCLACLAAVESMSAAFGRSPQASMEKAARAVKLLGATEATLQATGAALEAIERDIFARASEAAHQWLDEAAWEAAWQEGHAMDMDQAVTYARGALPHRGIASEPAKRAGVRPS